VGGGYDLYARLLARYLGKYIPGQPSIVPQNREGAGSLRAAIYIYNAAPKDGTVIGTFSRSMAVAPLLTDAPFDATRFTWLGSISTDVNVCMTWGSSPIKTWDDMLTKPFTMGGLGAGADPDMFALMFKKLPDVQIRWRDVWVGAAVTAGLFTLGKFLLGIYLILGRFWVDAATRARTFYGLTDRRAIIVSGLLSRTVKSLSLQTMTDVTLTERGDASGTIAFGQVPPWAGMYGGMRWPGMGSYGPPSFELIPDAKRIYGLIRQAQEVRR